MRRPAVPDGDDELPGIDDHTGSFTGAEAWAVGTIVDDVRMHASRVATRPIRCAAVMGNLPSKIIGNAR